MHKPLDPLLVDRLVRAALAEDLGDAGDITSLSVIPHNATASVIMRARQKGICAGMAFAETSFRLRDPAAEIEHFINDGDPIEAGTDVMAVTGNARALLSGERVALNFMGHLCGIATETAEMVAAIAGSAARICDTRKTLPGLRAAEKYAVRTGGGVNHRFGLYDAVLIKDNHIAVAGSITEALNRARDYVGHMAAIEIEVDTLAQLDEALAAGARIVLLDNMTPDQLSEAVRLNKGRAQLEASGRVSLETVRAIAQTGVDYISVGRLTHSAPCLDLGLDIDVTLA